MNQNIKSTVTASFFIALGLIVPQVFHMIGMGGPVFLPMHLPVLLCGFLLGPKYGVIVGLTTPIVSSLLTGMPVMYPVGITMVFELGTYGLIAGYLYQVKNKGIFFSLILSMLIGRLVSGIMSFMLLTINGSGFVLSGFFTASFVTSIWGITLQLLLIPTLIKALNHGGFKSSAFELNK
ncbi:MAG: ECF transporter S component [Turicibacter sp.]